MKPRLSFFLQLTAAVLALLVLLYVLSGALVAPLVKGFVLSRVESRLGLHLAVEKIEGTLAGSLDISGVKTLEAKPLGPVVDLALDRMRVEYSLPALLGGMQAFGASVKIDIKGCRLGLDLSTRPAGTEERSPGPALAKAGLIWPGALPEVRINDLSLALTKEHFSVQLTDMAATIEPVKRPGEPQPMHLTCQKAELLHPLLLAEPFTFASDLLLSPEAIVVEHLTANDKRVIDQARLDLRALPDGALSGEATVLLGQGRLEVSAARRGARMQGALKADAVRLEDIAGLFQNPYQEVGGALFGQGRLDVALDRPDTAQGAFTVQLRDGRGQGLSGVAMDLDATADNGAFRIARLEGRMGRNQVAVTDLEIPIETLLTRDLPQISERIIADLNLVCEDIPALLPAFGREPAKSTTPLPEHRLTLTGSMAGGALTLAGGGLETEAGLVRIDQAAIGLPTNGQTWSQAPVRAAIDVRIKTFTPLAALFGLPRSSGAMEGAINLDGTLSAPKGSVLLSGKGLVFADQPVQEFFFKARADTQELVVESLALQRGLDRIIGHGVLDLHARQMKDIALDLAIQDVAPYTFWFLPEQWKARGQVRASLVANGPWASPQASMEVVVEKAGLGKTDISLARCKLQSSGEDLVLDELSIKTGPEALLMKGGLKRSAPNSETHARIDTFSLSMGEIKQELAGPAHISSSPSGTFSISDFAWRGNAGTLQLSGKIPFDLFAPKKFLPGELAVDADLDCPSLRIFDALLSPAWPLQGAARAKLRLAGSWDRPSGSLELHGEQLRLPTRLGPLPSGLLTADCAFVAQPGQFLLQSLRVSGPGAFLHGSGSWSRAPALDKILIGHWQPELGVVAGQARLNMTDLAWIGEHVHGVEGVTGRLTAEGTLSGPLRSPLLDATVRLEDGSGQGVDNRFSIRGAEATASLAGSLFSPAITLSGSVPELLSTGSPQPLAGKFELTYAKEVFLIRQCNWFSKEGNRLNLAGRIPLDPFAANIFQPGELALDAVLEVPELLAIEGLLPPQWAARGTLSSSLHLAGTWEHPVGQLSLRAAGVNFDSPLAPRPPGPYALTCNIIAQEGRITCDSLVVESPAGGLKASGTWVDAPSLSLLLRAHKTDFTGSLEGSGKITGTDLAWLAQETKGIRRLGGKLSGEISIKGPARAPLLHADLRLADGELRPTSAIPSLRMVTAEASLDDRSLVLRSFRGELGGSPFEITGNLTKERDQETQVFLRLLGSNLLLVREEGIKVRGDTDLCVQGPMSRLNLSGKIALTDGEFFREFDLLRRLRGAPRPWNEPGLRLFSIRNPPFKDMTFGVAISAKSPFRVRNNTVNGALRPSIVLSGTGEIPILEGEVYVDQTRITVPAGKLLVDSGVALFSKTDPDRPRVNLVAGSRILGYDITVLAEGPFDEPVVTLSSVPPLSDSELLLLLLAGKPPKPRTGSEGGQAGHNVNVAMYLGRGLLGKIFGAAETGETDESILERFELEIGRGMTQAGEETIEAQFQLAKGFAIADDALFITAERDVFDDYNAGLKIVFRFK